MIITVAIIIAIASVFLGGAALATGHGVIFVACTALGIGWLAIVIASLRRIAAEALIHSSQENRS